jgi:hypothetical protein
MDNIQKFLIEMCAFGDSDPFVSSLGSEKGLDVCVRYLKWSYVFSLDTFQLTVELLHL